VAPRNRRTVHLDVVRENMKRIRAAVPQTAGVIAVVKADAYGHGAEAVSRAVLEAGADMLAVATVAEGTALRKAGIRAPILVLGPVTAGDVLEGVTSGLIQTVCSREMVLLLGRAAEEADRWAEAHLLFDTGMGRVGVRTEEEKTAMITAFAETPGVFLTGAMTHFSDADGGPEGREYTAEQFRRFLQMTEDLPDGVMRHCANSAAIHCWPEMALDAVRAGISLYGYPPVEESIGLRPCMRWTAKVSYVKDLPEGAYVSYGRTWRADGLKRIATVTCGYGDGYPRIAGGRAEVLIRGRRFPVVGRICMDQMMVDITGAEDIRPEDEVVLMGRSGGEEITAEDIARWSGTISYEILLSAGSRVERVCDGEDGGENT